jgi:peptidoglycan hydrolase-like protein with peptidoglycan-binding domain
MCCTRVPPGAPVLLRRPGPRDATLSLVDQVTADLGTHPGRDPVVNQWRLLLAFHAGQAGYPAIAQQLLAAIIIGGTTEQEKAAQAVLRALKDPDSDIRLQIIILETELDAIPATADEDRLRLYHALAGDYGRLRRHRRRHARRRTPPARPGDEPARNRRPPRHRHGKEERPASLASHLAVVAITASSGTSQTATHSALAAQTGSFPPANLDDCPILHAGYPRGGCVAQLQTDLRIVQDPNLDVDGLFGSVHSQTWNAVTAFQGAHGLNPDGMVGPATKQYLAAALSGSVPTPMVPPATVPPPTPSQAPSTPSTPVSPAGGSSPAAPAAGERLSEPGNGEVPAMDAPASTPAAPSSTPPGPSKGAQRCKGWGGVVNNIVGAVTGSLTPALLGEPDLGTPYLDGNVVRVDSSVPFFSYGSCANQVAFQMQTKVCGDFGCNWITRNHGKPEFFWAHDDTDTVAQQVTMACRPGTNSYRVLMQVYGLASAGELNDEDEPEAAGVELDNEAETGPVIKLTC